MAHSAKLISIDAVRDMAVALAIFADEAMGALDDLEINTQRAIEWVEHDRKVFWSHEVRKGGERLSEAKAELEKALTYRKMADQEPSCRQERAILQPAKQCVQTAEEKNRALPHWENTIKHGVQEVNGMQMQLANWLRNDLPKALSVLDQMTTALERYAAIQGGAAQEGTSQKASAVQSDETEKDKTEAEADDDPVAKTSETIEEPDHENLGSTHPGGKTPPGDEGSASGPR